MTREPSAMTEHFRNSEDLVAHFNFEDALEYSHLMLFPGPRPGFSVMREYPSDALAFPAVKKNGEADTVCCIQVSCEPPEDAPEPRESAVQGLDYLTGLCSLYIVLENKLSYDHSDESCPTPESVEKMKQCVRPVSLTSSDEFSFDHSSQTFTTPKGKPLTGMAMLNAIFEAHCDTVRKFKGLPFRTRLRTNQALQQMTLRSIQVVQGLLGVCFGRTLERGENILAGKWTYYPSTALVRDENRTVVIKGFKIAYPSWITFSVMVVLTCLLVGLLGGPPKWAQLLTSNWIGLLCLFSLGVAVVDILVPKLLFHCVNALVWLRRRFWVVHMKIQT